MIARAPRRGPPRLRRALLGLGLVASAAAPGCIYPVRQDAGCAQRISQCLASCPDDPGRERATRAEFRVATDTRTACERRCDALCR